MHAQVRDVTLEELVDREFSGEEEQEQHGITPEREEQQRAVAERTRLRAQLADSNTKLSEAEVASLTQTIQTLNSKIQDLGRQLDVQREQAIADRRARDQKRKERQASILFNAGVVCCTLSGSAHAVLSQLKIKFDAVIIDEAAQCIELSAVIPLRYGARYCVMVGDPHQLPPTVLSKDAASLKYEQSLFVRMFNQYPERVHLLNTQFRMHPSIAEFPSKEFYHGKLITPPDMAAKTHRQWHEQSSFGSGWHPSHLLQPYMFFDINGEHMQSAQNKSLRNLAEVSCAYSLFLFLKKSFPQVLKNSSIGIISPYKAQVEELRRKFVSMIGEQANLIDFNTVDGFQGQEKDIIILSCVRAQGDNGGVGFLSDIRRLNVAITRAKSSLWILGHAYSLTKNPVWRDLIEDAKDRGMYTCIDMTRDTGRGQFSPARKPRKPKQISMPPNMDDANDIRGSAELGSRLSFQFDGRKERGPSPRSAPPRGPPPSSRDPPGKGEPRPSPTPGAHRPPPHSRDPRLELRLDTRPPKGAPPARRPPPPGRRPSPRDPSPRGVAFRPVDPRIESRIDPRVDSRDPRVDPRVDSRINGRMPRR